MIDEVALGGLTLTELPMNESFIQIPLFFTNESRH